MPDSPLTPSFFSFGFPRISGMAETGYFPLLSEYQHQVTKLPGLIYAPEPLLPVSPTQNSCATVVGANTTGPDMSEPIQHQACSCPTSDACILETMALLQGSLGLLREVTELQHAYDAGLAKLLTKPCQLDMIFEDLLPLSDHLEVPEAAGRSMLLRRDSYLPTPATPDLCSFVRCRLDDCFLDPVDDFSPLQHYIHSLLKLLRFDTDEFRVHVRRMRVSQVDDDVGLMCRAYDQLARSSPKVYKSQFGEKLDALEAAIEGVAQQIALADDLASRSNSEIMERVASTMRFSCDVARLIWIPRAGTCA